MEHYREQWVAQAHFKASNSWMNSQSAHGRVHSDFKMGLCNPLLSLLPTQKTLHRKQVNLLKNYK